MSFIENMYEQIHGWYSPCVLVIRKNSKHNYYIVYRKEDNTVVGAVTKESDVIDRAITQMYLRDLLSRGLNNE